MTMKTLLAILVLSTSAFAGDAKPTSLKGDKAKPLLRALKLSGVKSTKSKSAWIWKAAMIECHSASETDDALGSYDCTIGTQKLADAAAAYLMDALEGAGAVADDHMSQTTVRASNLACTDDQGAKGGADVIYTCSFTPSTGGH